MPSYGAVFAFILTVEALWEQEEVKSFMSLSKSMPAMNFVSSAGRSGTSPQCRPGLRCRKRAREHPRRQTAALELKNSTALADVRAALVQYGVITP
jgi:hypothetical protein